MDKIVTMGDSHCQLFANEERFKRGLWVDNDLVNHFDVRWLGPVTFWRLCRDKKSFIDFDKEIMHYPYANMDVTTKLNENQNIILCFGEIDVRYHILNHGDDYRITIDDMVKEFHDYLESYQNRYKIHICSVLPPMTKFEHEDIPFVGTDEERRDITLYFNEKLEETAKKLNLGFFDLTPLYSNDKNMLAIEKSDNIVHAIKTLELEEKIKEYFNL
jgi:hypothetical protein